MLDVEGVPLQGGGTAAFDLANYIAANLGKKITLLVINENPDSLHLVTSSKEVMTPPILLLTSSFLNDLPAPFWELDIIPTDSGAVGAGPSASDNVNLASGVGRKHTGSRTW